MGFIFRATRGLTNSRALYCSLVRQLLEYASPVWSPHHRGLINILEGIQNKFPRLMGVRQDFLNLDVPVTALQADLHLQDLVLDAANALDVGDVVFLKKLLNGQADLSSLACGGGLPNTNRNRSR